MLPPAAPRRRPREANPEWQARRYNVASLGPAGIRPAHRGRDLEAGRDLEDARAGRARHSGFPPARCQGEAFTNRPSSYSVVPAEPTQSDVLEAGRVLEAGGRTALDTLDGLAPSPCSRLCGTDGGAGCRTKAGSRVNASPYQRLRGNDGDAEWGAESASRVKGPPLSAPSQG